MIDGDRGHHGQQGSTQPENKLGSEASSETGGGQFVPQIT